MTVEAIKEAISGLGDDERHSLAVWISEIDGDAWDRQMVEDFSPGGRGEHLVEKVKADIAAGKFRPVDDLCAERKKNHT
jgi:hypothetical protein